MPKNCFIGIDQGSSSTKALVISGEGQVLFQTRKPVAAAVRTGERVEYNAGDLVASVQDALRESMQSISGAGFSIRGIGLACQRSSCLLWNEKTGDALSPVISWRDLRGMPLVQELSPDSVYIFETTGLPLTPYYAASKFRWLKDNLAGADSGGAVFGTLSSYLAQRLTGSNKAAIDHTQAARTQLMNIHTLAWDPRLIERFGLSGINLPSIVPVIDRYGEVPAAGNAPLLVCVGDQQAAMVGLGVLERNDAGINYGTGGFLLVNTGTALVPAAGLMASIHYSSRDTRHYLLEGSVNAAGDALEWIRNRLRMFSDYAEVDDECWQAATDVVAFIALNGTGAPWWEHSISSSVHGMTPESTKADIIRGAVEGIAFFMKEIDAGMRAAGADPAAYVVSGGLSSLSYLVQVQADLLNRELRVSGQQEVTALGAALLAGMAEGAWSVSDIRKLTASGETITPRKNAGAGKRYRRWRELHKATAAIDAVNGQ